MGFDEKADQAAWEKIDHSIDQSIIKPAENALSKRQFGKALLLQKKAVAAWTKLHFNSNWSKDAQSTRICESLQREGDILERLGRYDQAAQMYLQCEARAAKGEAGGYMRLAGRAYVDGGLYDKAKQTYERVMKLGDREETLLAHLDLSDMYQARGRPKDAESELTSFLRTTKSPTDVRSIRVALKTLYLKLNRKQDAHKIDALLNDMHCPVCGSSKNVEPIQYGMQAAPGPAAGYHAGGCMVSPDSPQWWCKTDNISF